MMSERFLRDGIFDDMLKEVQALYDAIQVDDSTDEFYLYYIESLLSRFKENRVLYSILEKTIESIRTNNGSQEISGPLTEAAMHIQSEVKTLFELLLYNTSSDQEPFDFSNLSL